MHTVEVGGGNVTQQGNITRFAIPSTTQRAYADSQWDDYYDLPRSRFPHRAPVRLSLSARFSHEADRLGGTAGFGFWNNPFSMLSRGLPSSPNVLWFFAASPPNDQYLCDGVPGQGWKAASLNTGGWPGLVVAPGAAVAILLARLPGLGRPIMKLARRMIRTSERLIEARMTEWHDYAVERRAGEAAFWVDGIEVLRAAAPPAGPLGFVAWVDNQYAIASEEGRFGFGLIGHDQERWMEIEGLTITNNA
ncbi:MAG: hypothetical protein HYZ49_15695 [Chloroflexi bacterium]|nr:hypothetical protein [Chloroflexota bacterium]